MKQVTIRKCNSYCKRLIRTLLNLLFFDFPVAFTRLPVMQFNDFYSKNTRGDCLAVLFGYYRTALTNSGYAINAERFFVSNDTPQYSLHYPPLARRRTRFNEGLWSNYEGSFGYHKALKESLFSRRMNPQANSDLVRVSLYSFIRALTSGVQSFHYLRG